MVTTIAGEVPASVASFRFPLADSVGGHVLRTGSPERLADFRGRMRSFLAEHVDAESGLIVPLRFRDRRLGILVAFDRLEDGPEFSAEDERLLVGFAASAATAVATAQSMAGETLRAHAGGIGGRASALGPRAARRDPAGARRAAGPALRRRGAAVTRTDSRQQSTRPSGSSPAPSATSARSSPTCARPHWTSWGSRPRSRA